MKLKRSERMTITIEALEGVEHLSAILIGTTRFGNTELYQFSYIIFFQVSQPPERKVKASYSTEITA